MTSLLLHTFLGLLLLLIPAGALYLADRRLLHRLGVALGRMVVQLAVLCLLVWVVIRVDSLWLSLLWLVAMSVVSAVVALRRLRLPVGRFLPAVGVGLLLGVFLVGLWLLAVALPDASWLSARWFVPVSALLLGHSLSMMIRGLGAFVSSLQTDEQQYEFLRGNGARRLDALLPFVRRALQAVLAPTAANLSLLGLFTMPLLLVGLLLGGLSPQSALATLLILVAGCVAASVLSLLTAIALASRLFFDKLGKFVSPLS